MNDIKWSDKELMLAFKDVQADLDMFGYEIRRRGISWQTLADYGIRSRAIVGYINENGLGPNRCTFSEARAAVESHIKDQKKALIARLCHVLASAVNK